jgi:hypothetical protein
MVAPMNATVDTIYVGRRPNLQTHASPSTVGNAVCMCGSHGDHGVTLNACVLNQSLAATAGAVVTECCAMQSLLQEEALHYTPRG